MCTVACTSNTDADQARAENDLREQIDALEAKNAKLNSANEVLAQTETELKTEVGKLAMSEAEAKKALEARPEETGEYRSRKIGLVHLEIEQLKRSNKKVWDQGQKSPDPYWVVYLNDKLITKSIRIKDSYFAQCLDTPAWPLRPSDKIHVQIRDSDNGAKFALKMISMAPGAGLVSSEVAGAAASDIDTDDDVFEWRGTVADIINDDGKSVELVGSGLGEVVHNDGAAHVKLLAMLEDSENPGCVELAPEAAETHFTVHVTIASHKSNGKFWDTSEGPPDPYVFVRIPGESKPRTAKAKDVHYAALEFPSLPIAPGQRIDIEVHDKDLASNDPVGQVSFEIEAGVTNYEFKLDSGAVKIELRPAGRKRKP